MHAYYSELINTTENEPAMPHKHHQEQEYGIPQGMRI